MTPRRLLYLDTHRLTAYLWRQGNLTPEGVFDTSDEDQARFADYLDTQRDSQFALLANVAEEGHVVETIPFLQGVDRQALITRKIGQHFLGTPLATAFSLGYEKKRRKDEKLLLSALTNPAHFEPWLFCLKEASAPLSGIFTVAQLGGSLLRKLGLLKKHCLLLSLQDHSIRESFLVEGQALFSRMAPLADSSITGLASSFAAEAGKLHQYLIGQRLISRDEALTVFVLAHPQAFSAIDKACIDRGHLNFSIVDSHTAARQIGLRTLPEDNRSDGLFLHLLASAPPRQQFAGEGPRHDYRLTQIRQGILAVGLITLLGSLLFAAQKSYETVTLLQESAALKLAESELGTRYREISATFPQLGIDNDTLRRLTNRYQDLKGQQHLPDEAFRQLAAALDRMPAVTLTDLDWKIIAAGKPARADFTLDGNAEVLTVRGAIHAEKNTSSRQILASFDQFVALLRETPDSEINILQQPFDMEPGRTLRGGDSEDETLKPRQFTVEIIRKIAP